MSGTMSKADLVADLKAILGDAALKFTAANDADFDRHLVIAATDLTRIAPTMGSGYVTLVADQDVYSPPADFRRFGRALYGDADRARQPWDRVVGQMPQAMVIHQGATPKLMLRPRPSAALIAALGTKYEFTYVIAYVIGAQAADTTVPDRYRALLLTRATAQALQELANFNISKPVSLGSSSVGLSMPKNGHPAALAQDLLDLCERMAAAA